MQAIIMRQHMRERRQRNTLREITNVVNDFLGEDNANEMFTDDFPHHASISDQRKTVLQKFLWPFFAYFLMFVWLILTLRGGFEVTYKCSPALYWVGVINLFTISFAVQSFLVLFLISMTCSSQPTLFWKFSSTAIHILYTLCVPMITLYGSIILLAPKPLKCRKEEAEISTFWLGCSLTTFAYGWVFSVTSCIYACYILKEIRKSLI